MSKIEKQVVSRQGWTQESKRAGAILLLILGWAVLLLVRSHLDIRAAEKRLYTSKEHGFSADFHGQPSGQKSTLILVHGNPNVTTSCTNYGTKDTDATVYEVAVCDFPTMYDASDTDKKLQIALNSAVNDPSIPAKLVSSSFGQFVGHRAINGEITVTSGITTHYVYVKFFLKGHTLYSVQTFDATQAERNAFFSSFRLNR